MQNKKAEITLENTLAVILAVLGLVLLFYGAIKLYQVTVNQESENAKKIINIVEERINSLKDEEQQTFLITGQKDWFIVGWSKDDSKRPDKCYFDSCICICPTNTANPSESCQEKGFCREINKKELVILGTKIQTLGTSFPAPYIKLADNLEELNIYKTANKLQVTINS